MQTVDFHQNSFLTEQRIIDINEKLLISVMIRATFQLPLLRKVFNQHPTKRGYLSCLDPGPLRPPEHFHHLQHIHWADKEAWLSN
jgi:hypothetical protein